jgi:hypothetical protein
MSAKPFLFLDSPRVGGVGHAFILSPDCQTPPEEHLVSLSTKARASQAHSEELIAVQHTVLQADTNRSGPELLICAGAIPESSADIAAIREVLEELWSNEVTGEDLHQDKVIRRAALIYEAPCMKRITAGFHEHPRVRQVRWETVNLEREEQAGSGVIPTPISAVLNQTKKSIRWIMKHPILVLVGIVGAIAVAKAFEETRKKLPIGRDEAPKTTVSSKPERLKRLEFLASGEWLRVMKATGGTNLVEKFPDLLLKVRGDKKKLSEEELNQIKSVTTEIDAWFGRFSSEFALGGGGTPEKLESEKFTKFLKVAKDTKGKVNVAAWITDYNDQREQPQSPEKRYPPEILKQARALDDFSKIVGNPPPPPEHLPVLLRDTWHALDVFSKEPGEDQRKFKALIGDVLKNVGSPPPDGFETLTLKDAQRLGAIQRILDSGEFGFVVTGEAYKESEQKDWHKIKARINLGMLRAKDPENDLSKASEVLLLALGKSFGLARKPTTGQ